MKIQYISDLHLEFGGPSLQDMPVTGDILVLAGDVSTGIKGLMFANYHSNNYEAVIMVAGNHEHYGKEYKKNLKKLKEFDTKDNVHFLENSSVTVNGITFLGATLWSNLSNPFDAQTAKFGMNDYHVVKYQYAGGYGKFSPEISTKIHFSTLNWLENHIKENSVVITHFLPHFDCINNQYRNSALNSAYASDLDQLIFNTKPQVWFHGHTHDTVDITVYNTNILCNPRGYHPHNLNKEFDIGKIVEI